MTVTPRSRFPFADVPRFLRDKLGLLQQHAFTEGEQPSELFLGGRTLLLRSAADVRHVLVSSAALYEKSPRLIGAAGRQLYRGSLLSMRHEESQRLRRHVRPAFQREVVQSLVATATPWIDAMLAAWSRQTVVDVAPALTHLAERLSTTVLFGIDVAREFDQLMEFVDARRRYVELRLGLPLPALDRLPLPAVRRYHQQERIWVPRLREKIATARTAGSGGLVAAMLRGSGDDGSGLDPAQALNEVIALLVAGFETTAEWLVWTLLLLAENPGEQEELRADLAPSGDRQDLTNDLPGAVVEKGHLLEQTVKESLRLYPPTWLIVRHATQADRLPTGAAVDVGTKLYICPYTLHRTERYFPEPERFLPERFAVTAVPQLAADAFIPFGLGPRRCLGEAIAYLEAKLVVHRVLERFRLRRADAGEIRPHPGVTLRAIDPVRLVLAPIARHGGTERAELPKNAWRFAGNR